MKKFQLLIFAVSVVLLSACSSTSEYKGVYGEIEKTTSLDVPPGLDQPDDNSAKLPEQLLKSGYYSDYSSSQGKRPAGDFLHAYKDIRFVREGSLYWLEVNDYPEKIWPDLHTFFNKVGLKISYEQPQLGIMQTEWKENRVGLPTGWFLGLFGRLSSTGLLDSYRVRLEFDEDKIITRIFVSHRGMREIVEGEDNNIDVVLTKWVPRRPDPELEIEMLMRFMTFRGMDEKIAKEDVSKVKIVQRTELIKNDDSLALKVNEVFPRTWRHVGLALDRMGVLVEDRNRSAGIYYITLPETFEIKNEGGFFGAFGDNKSRPSTDKYLLSVQDKGDTTVVVVKSRGEVGKDLSKVSEKILKEIQNNIL